MSVTANGGKRSVLRERRRKLGLTQAQLAEAAGLTQQTISRLERGTDIPQLSTALALAKVLGCRVKTLLPVEEQEEASA